MASKSGGEWIRDSLDLMVLSVVAEEPRYGYLIQQRLGEASGGRVRPQAGTLYPLLHRLEADGLATLRQLRDRPEPALVARYGAIGRRLAHFARGRDDRPVEPNAVTKSLSAETTLDQDVADPARLGAVLWPLCEKLAERLKHARLASGTVTLKLKTANFRLLTRRRRLSAPTQLADTLYRTARRLLDAEATGTPFRLVGIVATELTDQAHADPPDLLDPDLQRRIRVERAIDRVRDKMGRNAIMKGRSWSGVPAAPEGRAKPTRR